jgi:hypothetical protein
MPQLSIAGACLSANDVALDVVGFGCRLECASGAVAAGATGILALPIKTLIGGLAGD